jgi:hypothetical protein
MSLSFEIVAAHFLPNEELVYKRWTIRVRAHTARDAQTG